MLAYSCFIVTFFNSSTWGVHLCANRKFLSQTPNSASVSHENGKSLALAVISVFLCCDNWAVKSLSLCCDITGTIIAEL